MPTKKEVTPTGAELIESTKEPAEVQPDIPQEEPNNLEAVVKKLATALKQQASEIIKLNKANAELNRKNDALQGEIEGLSADVLEAKQLNKAQGERLASLETQANKFGSAISGVKKRIEKADDLNPNTRGYLMKHSKSNPSTVIPVQFNCTYAEAVERQENDDDGSSYFFWPFVGQGV